VGLFDVSGALPELPCWGRFLADGVNSLAGALRERLGVMVSGQLCRFLLFDPGTGQWCRKGFFSGKSVQIKPFLA